VEGILMRSAEEQDGKKLNMKVEHGNLDLVKSSQKYII
jgi:hypothetical protein